MYCKEENSVQAVRGSSRDKGYRLQLIMFLAGPACLCRQRPHARARLSEEHQVPTEASSWTLFFEISNASRQMIGQVISVVGRVKREQEIRDDAEPG